MNEIDKNKYYDFNFDNIESLIHRVIFRSKKLDDKLIFNKDKIILSIYTKDDKFIEAIKETTDVKEILETLIKITENRLKTKQSFHFFIEENYPNSTYEVYPLLYKEYNNFITDGKNQLNKKIQSWIKIHLQALELDESKQINYIEVNRYLKKIFFSLKSNISTLHKKLNDTDFSKTNISNEWIDIWLGSLNKIHEDKITKAFRNKTFQVEKNHNSDEFEGFAVALYLATQNERLIIGMDLKSELILQLIQTFEGDMEIVKALCTAEYKGKKIMDYRTFESKVKQSEYIQLTLSELSQSR